MNSKPHRQNSDFQLRHFLAGSCATPDGAYVLLYGQQVDMQNKLEHAKSQLSRRQAKLKAVEAKKARAQSVIDAHKENSGSGLLHDVLQAEADLLDAEADRLEVEADIPVWEMNHKAAQDELNCIQALMLEIRPQCKYAHLNILEMAEASQEEEWLGELKKRAENFLMTAGTIPHDHFDTMRMHPQFKEKIVPHLQMMQQKIELIGARDPRTGELVDPTKTIANLMVELEQPKLTLAAPKAGEA